ncbi:DUF4286 family protein [soil metagenome]
MLIYNVTTGVDKKIEQEWVHWMKTKHIPDVMATGMFVGHKLFKILSVESEDSVSYAVQYSARSLNEIERYLEEFAPALREHVSTKYGEAAVSFRTLLEEV